MKTEIRLGSVVAHGVGGPEAAAIDMIYIYLLHEFGQDFYNRIGINQIGNDLNEFVIKEPGNKMHVNIRYPIDEDFETKTNCEKNRIRLDVIHQALLRVAEYDNKLQIDKLNLIKDKILQNDFAFDFTVKSFINKKNPILVGKVIVSPLMEKFVYYVVIEENGLEKCRKHLYNGITGVFFCEDFFCYGKWKSDNEFILEGKRKEVQTILKVNDCQVELINLTRYNKPPYYILMNADASTQDKEIADKDWHHSLPPAVAAIVRRANN